MKVSLNTIYVCILFFQVSSNIIFHEGLYILDILIDDMRVYYFLRSPQIWFFYVGLYIFYIYACILFSQVPSYVIYM